MRGSLALALTVALSACVQERPGVPTADGTLSYTEKTRGAAVLSGGAGYHGAYLKTTPEEPEQATKPAAAAKVAPGKLPLPTDYPLLPGDAELWPTLTRAEQERALLFLKDGSSIRASLRTE